MSLITKMLVINYRDVEQGAVTWHNAWGLTASYRREANGVGYCVEVFVALDPNKLLARLPDLIEVAPFSIAWCSAAETGSGF